MPVEPSPRRRRLAAELRRIREERGLALGDVIGKVKMSKAKLSRIETGETAAQGDDVFALCQFYEVDAKTTARLVDLARLAKASPWFHEYAGALGSAADYLELELDAVQVAEFEADVIPGQLQTEGYAEAVIRHGHPDGGDEQIAALVALRMERQRQMAERRPSLRVIIDEAALRRPIGGAAVMAGQLEHLEAMTRQPGLTVQVLPLEITGHAALGVPFTLITLPDGTQYVYRDGVTGGTYTDESHEVEAYRETWGRLQAEALGYARSVTLIREIRAIHRSKSDARDSP